MAVILAAVLIVPGLTFYLRPLTVMAGVGRIGMWRHGVESHEVLLGKNRIHYLTSGAGRPLVLVHGLGGSGDNWLPLIPSLTAMGFKVYAPDLLGYGSSDKPDVDYSIASQADVVAQFMDSQGLQQADMAGWSMGGWVGLKLAAARPERVRRLMLFASAGMKFDAVNAPLLLPHSLEDLDKMRAVLSPHPQPLPEYVRRDILRHLQSQEWIVRRALLSMGTGQDLMDGKLATVKAPVLIVWGKEDVLTPPAVGEAIHREIPQSQLDVIEGCGHLVPVECKDRVLPEVGKFLR